MRQVINGNGNDSTAATLAYLKAGHQFKMANLYLIGEQKTGGDFSISQMLTDWEAPILWRPWGTFKPAAIRRGTVTSRIGLEVDSLDIEWSPPPAPYTSNIDTANPYQLARLGTYSNTAVRVWTVYMPTPGDADTFGASELFGGRIARVSLTRGLIRLSVNSFLDVVNQVVPTGTIGIQSTLAQFKGATPPPGLSVVPRFNVISGSDTTLVLDCVSPTLHQIFDTDIFQYGFVVFNPGTGATLAAEFSAVRGNILVNIGGTDYNQVGLLRPLPWSPTPGVDTCYISAPFPVNYIDPATGLPDPTYADFPYVPPPETTV